MHEPIDADLDAGAGHVVPQAVDPVPVDGRDPDAHGTSVAYGLRLSSGGSSEAHASIPLSPQPKPESSAFSPIDHATSHRPDSVVYEFVHFGLWNCEPETNWGAHVPRGGGVAVQ